jgi:hypothetical protein
VAGVHHLVALLATVVAVQYVAITHAGIAATERSSSGMGMAADSGSAAVHVHVLPHVAQVIGGALFIGIIRDRLEVSITSEEAAAELRTLTEQFQAAFERAPRASRR